MLGTMMMWVGFNNMFDMFVGTPSAGRSWIYMMSGLVGVLATGTLDHTAYVWSTLSCGPSARLVTWRDPLWVRVKTLVRATVIVMCQNLMWLGSWNYSGLNQYDNFGTGGGYYVGGMTLYVKPIVEMTEGSPPA